MGQQLAEVEDIDKIAYPHHQAHVVIDQQHRHVEAFSHRVQQVSEVRGLLRVKPRRGLVQQQQPWPHRQGAGDLDAPLDAGRQIARRCSRIAPEVEHVEDRARALG